MTRTLVAIAALALAGTAVAAEGAAGIYAARCNACHGKDGKGTAVGKKMGAPDLTALGKGEAEIAFTIANGKGKMTPFRDKLSEADIQALAKFVKGGLK
ncbi:MAG TPA: cytochrome c [Anaeromyxobacter sp.]|nr:cytochrome c [Anaeromyxobacter sp.]